MKIHHTALWVRDLEGMKDFYARWFDGKPGGRYVNRVSSFESYFVEFPEGGKIELMRSPSRNTAAQGCNNLGFAHIALSTGSREAVDSLARDMVKQGIRLVNVTSVSGDF